MYERMEKIFAYAMMVILCISLLPVMYVGRYNHPTGDDYYYGVETRELIENGGSLFEVLGEAAKGVALQYERWQGTYSAMFLMYLPPNVFAEGAYALVTAFMILLFSGSAFYLLKPIVCHLMKGSCYLWMLVSATYVLLCLQTVNYFIGESLFWYNGSMYYTGYYAVTMFFWGMVVRLLYQPKKYYMPILAVLALFLAGGNYVSLLPCILLLVAVTGILAWKRSKKGWLTGSLVVLLIIGLLISAAAPGNQMREGELWEMSATKAIMKSLYQGMKYIKAWIGSWWALAVLLLTPFLWKGLGRLKFRFPYPLIVTGFMYGIFCSMACPTFYAMNSTGPGRALAIEYYGINAFMLFSYYYLLGYVHRVVAERREKLTDGRGYCTANIVIASLFVVLMIVQIGSGKMQECTTVRAVRLLRSGEAVAYHEEYLERLEILQDNSIQDVVFKPYTHQPDMLYVGDFTGDASNGNNIRIAEYWGKNSIRVDYGQ